MGPVTVKSNKDNDLKFRQGLPEGMQVLGVDIGKSPDYSAQIPLGESGSNEGELEYFTE